MNVVLVEPHELDQDAVASLGGRRAEHVATVLGKRPGDALSVGKLGGELGRAEVLECEVDRLRLRCTFDTLPPPKSNVRLVLALPRPLVLRRVLQHITALGVGHIVLLHTRRVEKSYWQSPALGPAALREQLVLGLEQAVDTRLPELEVARAFRPFAEDRLPALVGEGRCWVADPSASEPCPVDVTEPTTLLIGPEGGFIPFELELLERLGHPRVSLGARVLRVETAVVAALARLG